MLDQMQKEMLELLAAGTNVQAVIDRGASLLGNPILVVDTRFRIPYMSRTERGTIELWKKAKVEGCVSDAVLADLQKENTIEQLKRMNGPVTQTLPNGYQSVRYALWNRGQYCGFVGMYDYIRPFSDAEVEALSAVAMALSALSSNDPNFTITRDEHYENELFQLLCCKSLEEAKVISGQLNEMKLPEWKVLYLIDAGQQAKMPIGRLKELLHQKIHLPAMAMYEDRLVILLNGAAGVARQKSSIHQILEEMCASLGATLAKSFVYRDIVHTPVAYMQARFCLQKQEKGTQTSFRRVYPLAVRTACTARYPAEYFVHPVFRIVQRYDEEYGVDYLHTLLLYLKNQGNRMAVAEKLGIHYNTVKHRIAVIEGIIGHSLRDDPEFLHILQISMIFME